jgi:hypothetical protein
MKPPFSFVYGNMIPERKKEKNGEKRQYFEIILCNPQQFPLFMKNGS